VDPKCLGRVTLVHNVHLDQLNEMVFVESDGPLDTASKTQNS